MKFKSDKLDHETRSTLTINIVIIRSICSLIAEISWQIQLYLVILHGNLEAEI